MIRIAADFPGDQFKQQIKMEKQKMISIVRSVKLTLIAHPDNEENSEFQDQINSLEELERALRISSIEPIELKRKVLIHFMKDLDPWDENNPQFEKFEQIVDDYLTYH